MLKVLIQVASTLHSCVPVAHSSTSYDTYRIETQLAAHPKITSPSYGKRILYVIISKMLLHLQPILHIKYCIRSIRVIPILHIKYCIRSIRVILISILHIKYCIRSIRVILIQHIKYCIRSIRVILISILHIKYCIRSIRVILRIKRESSTMSDLDRFLAESMSLHTT